MTTTSSRLITAATVHLETQEDADGKKRRSIRIVLKSQDDAIVDLRMGLSDANMLLEHLTILCYSADLDQEADEKKEVKG